MIRYILASASPRRTQLLKWAGLHFLIKPSGCEENTQETDPEKIVRDLSRQKAEDIASGFLSLERPLKDCTVIIGADTVVSVDGRVLGKPANVQEAGEMIHLIQGRRHQVYTGVTLVWNRTEEELEQLQSDEPVDLMRSYTFSERTDVDVYPMSDEEIEHYVLTREPYDKAGGYGIQGDFGINIRGIVGDYNNVVGLPVSRLVHELKQRGLWALPQESEEEL